MVLDRLRPCNGKFLLKGNCSLGSPVNLEGTSQIHMNVLEGSMDLSSFQVLRLVDDGLTLLAHKATQTKCSDISLEARPIDLLCHYSVSMLYASVA